MDVDAPVFDVDGVGLGKPYVAVDAAATVPTGIGLIRVVYSDCHYVLALVDIRGDIVLETAIAVRAKTDFVAVNIDRGVHVNAVELEEEEVARIPFCHLDRSGEIS